ncbi:Uncharacterized conserved protein, DUF1697 family [Cognatiyoonia koreensis]|uniref:Uncharacterized conserved protein, DUF1697 family n=1 Tax=Cognatiyoonia koreensis TaxID=364200 RepID=A0A1I0PIB6_9RHOB|nr:DUF1697 domain-containing protein [Cognatiyoonia koreensis]SEW13955.1 Uncharacterized conserved protein, DUF1697 family [Cognatiyoonia koreensis]
MQTFVALLRGINVGGRNMLAMEDLRAICEKLGWQDVQTYVNSGNVVFRAEGGAEALAAKLHAALPIDVAVLVLRASELKARLSHCPIKPESGNLLHAYFCLDAPDVDQDVIAHYKRDEKVVIKGHTVWLYTPGGFSNSLLAEKFDKAITGTTYTARNLNTIRNLVDMCPVEG